MAARRRRRADLVRSDVHLVFVWFGAIWFPHPLPAAPLHCFSWVHGASFSTDCYDTVATCETAREDMERGARSTTPCRSQPTGSCTMVSRPPTSPTPTRRCFGDRGACGRYRLVVTRNGLTTTQCTPP